LLAAPADQPTNAWLDRFTADDALAALPAPVQPVVIGFQLTRDLRALLRGAPFRMALVSLDSLLAARIVNDSVLPNALVQPGQFAETRDLFDLLDSPLGEALLAEVSRAKEFVAIGYWTRGQSSLVSRTEIRTAADFRGKKISTSASPLARQAALDLGASPVQVGAAEVTAALQAGLFDTVEAGPALSASLLRGGDGTRAISGKFRPMMGFLVADADRWAALTEREKAAIVAATGNAEKAARAAALANEATLEADAQARNITFINLAATDPGGMHAANEAALSARFGVAGRTTLRDVRQVREAAAAARNTPRPGRAELAATASVPVLFVTTRRDEGGNDARLRFGALPDQAQQLRCGEIAYDPAGSREAGTTFAGAIAVRPAVLPAGLAACVDLIAHHLSQSGRTRVMLFIHGFRNTFEDAVRRAITTATDVGYPGIVLVWSWPADGRVSNYMRDEDNARLTEFIMPTFIAKLLPRTEFTKLDLLAHSMGTRIALKLLHALQEDRERAKIDQVVLAAPDETRDIVRFVMSGPASQLGRMRTLYAAAYDWPLRVSSWLHGNDRAGLAGDDLLVLRELDSIDATAAERSFWGIFTLSHAHVFDVPKAIADLRKVLVEGSVARERSLTERAHGGLRSWVIPP
jgi:esterase/lipase superfamily enzyme